MARELSADADTAANRHNQLVSSWREAQALILRTGDRLEKELVEVVTLSQYKVVDNMEKVSNAWSKELKLTEKVYQKTKKKTQNTVNFEHCTCNFYSTGIDKLYSTAKGPESPTSPN